MQIKTGFISRTRKIHATPMTVVFPRTTRRRRAAPVDLDAADLNNIEAPAVLNMTQRVQVSASLGLDESYVAFKIVPQNRLPLHILARLEEHHEWGAQVMFTGGLIGSVVVEDLAWKTSMDGVLHVSWEMPGLRNGQMLGLHSVMVRSTGEAEEFPPDPLVAMHAADLAEATRGAHVFHFFRKADSMLFQSLLLSRILETLN